MDLMEIFAVTLDRRYRAKLEDVEPTETPGYWKFRHTCGGRGLCQEPLHSFVFNEGGTQHTLQYHDPGRDRFATWRLCRLQTALRDHLIESGLSEEMAQRIVSAARWHAIPAIQQKAILQILDRYLVRPLDERFGKVMA